MRSDVQTLINHDAAISAAQRASSISELLDAYQKLPFLLGAVAVEMYGWQSYSSEERRLDLPSQSSLYRAAITLAYARALITGPNQAFTLDGLLDETFHHDFDEIGITRQKWRERLGFALSRLYQQKVLLKVQKGTYRLRAPATENI
jgi:hypothetical protein